MTPLELAILGLLILAITVVLVWGVVRVNLRLAEQNRDQLKMIGALTGNPKAADLAQSMETGDRRVSPEPTPMHARRLAGA